MAGSSLGHCISVFVFPKEELNWSSIRVCFSDGVLEMHSRLPDAFFFFCLLLVAVAILIVVIVAVVISVRGVGC